MEQILLKPSIHKFNTCRQFADEFRLGEKDLILTNESIYSPYFGGLCLPVSVLYQEKYGAGEPTDVMADAILADASKIDYSRVIAIGGGTILDIAKILAVSGGEPIDSLYGAPRLTKRHELILVPTTCGTGSEVTNIAIVNRTKLGVKMGLTGPAMYAEKAVLIPELLAGLPFGVFATSSIDALVHSVESALSPDATPYTRLFSYRAMEMIVRGYQKIVRDGKEARRDLMEDFLIASNFAGIAFGTAGCACVHAMSYPLGGKYHVAHGESNYAVFTGVLKNYMEIRQDGEIAVLNRFLADLLDCEAADVYNSLETLLNQILQKKALHEYGVTEADLSEFAASVVKTQGRLLRHSFVPVSEERILKIYRELY